MVARHRQINGVEVFFAPETPRQICNGFGRGQKLVADRTKEAKITLAEFARNIQFANQIVDRNEIP